MMLTQKNCEIMLKLEREELGQNNTGHFQVGSLAMSLLLLISSAYR